MPPSLLQRKQAASALRTLIRAQRLTFAGDTAGRAAASELNRKLLAPLKEQTSSPQDIDSAILGAQQAAIFFRSNLVQGALQQESTTYKLRITKDTEIRDNDSIKQGLDSSISCC